MIKKNAIGKIEKVVTTNTEETIVKNGFLNDNIQITTQSEKK